MFKTILVPTDGSALSDKAVAAAVEFAKRHGCCMVALSVAEPYPFASLSEMSMADDRDAYEERARAAAGFFVDKVATAARESGVRCETVVAQSFAPYEEIIKVAGKSGCDVIFMSSHGRKGLGKLLLGSETQKVLTHTSIPVLVFR
jgi:nucleotide-binding universal stress UspA family protein